MGRGSKLEPCFGYAARPCRDMVHERKADRMTYGIVQWVGVDGRMVEASPTTPLPVTKIALPNTLKSVNRARVKPVYMLATNPQALSSTIVWSPLTMVDTYKELLVIASLTAVQTGTPATFVLYVQTVDPLIMNQQVGVIANAMAYLPGGKISIASPLNTLGPVTDATGVSAVLQLTNFGVGVRVGVSAATPWSTSSASGLSVILLAKE
jgi:hypothetical protein